MRIAVTMIAAMLLSASAEAQSRRWDQDKAREKLKRVLAVEAQGQPWNKIAWLTDPAKAVEQARKTDRPLLVYFYLRKNVGPAADPG